MNTSDECRLDGKKLGKELLSFAQIQIQRQGKAIYTVLPCMMLRVLESGKHINSSEACQAM